jgi:hypothetical protein
MLLVAVNMCFSIVTHRHTSYHSFAINFFHVAPLFGPLVFHTKADNHTAGLTIYSCSILLHSAHTHLISERHCRALFINRDHETVSFIIPFLLPATSETTRTGNGVVFGLSIVCRREAVGLDVRG